MVSGQRGLPGAHALEEMCYVTAPEAVPERAQTLRLLSAAKNAVDTHQKTFCAPLTALVSCLSSSYRLGFKNRLKK